MMPAATTHALIRPALLTALLATLLSLTACKSAPEYCATKVEPYAQKTWEPFCEQVTSHVEDPQEHSLKKLTSFLAGYPLKAEEIRNEMVRYKEADRCYAEGAQQLRYKRLKSCVADDEEMASRAVSAWKVAGEDWFKEYSYQTKKLHTNLKKLVTEAERTNRRIEEKYELKVTPKKDFLATFLDTLQEERARAKKVEKYEAEYKEMIKIASGYQALQAGITTEFGEEANTLAKLQTENREMLAKLKREEHYFVYAAPGAGRSCPRSSGSRKHRRIAGKLLRERIKEVQGSKAIIITKPAAVTEKGPAMFERFTGHVCGVRGAKNQFDKRRVLCGTYTFTVERVKGVEDKRWDEWVLKQFTEDGPKTSMDCKLF